MGRCRNPKYYLLNRNLGAALKIQIQHLQKLIAYVMLADN